MACEHKFKDWLNLPYHLVDWEVKILIVGTFTPKPWENCDNNAEWFYGRVQNNYLWKVLPELKSNNKVSLISNTKLEWIHFCRSNNIGFTDLIETISDAEECNKDHKQLLFGKNFSDSAISKNFKKFKYVDISQILDQRASISEVYLTNGGSGMWGKRWKEDVVQYQINNPNRSVHIKTLYTPSKEARYWQSRSGIESLSEFIKFKWIEKGFKM